MNNFLQGVLVALTIALLGALVQTYMDVHDLKHDVAEQRSKIEWLYQATGH